MFDLLAAGDSRRDDFDIGTGRFNRGGEAAIADGQRQIVVLFLEAKGARHAAAARVDFADFEAGGLQNGDCRRRSDQRFLMTVTVEQRLAPALSPGSTTTFPAFSSFARNSSSRKLFSETRLASLVRTNSGYSSRKVSKQDGSNPTIGTPFSAYPDELVDVPGRVAFGFTQHAF